MLDRRTEQPPQQGPGGCKSPPPAPQGLPCLAGAQGTQSSAAFHTRISGRGQRQLLQILLHFPGTTEISFSSLRLLQNPAWRLEPEPRSL